MRTPHTSLNEWLKPTYLRLLALMICFFLGVLKDGKRLAEALRAAQLEMWKQKKYRAPYYWAAFQMQGEWR